VKFGIFALPTYFPEIHGSIADFYQHIVELLEEAERLGFDSAWVNEHHFHAYGGMIPDPPVLLGAIASRTSRIRIGTSVALLPLHNPLEAAEAYAMVDQLSGGRLELGIGRGFMRYDYDALGVSWDESYPLLKETLAVMREAWAHQPFSHHGQYFHYDDVSVWPVPLQRPHPPLWGAATHTPATFRWIGSEGMGLLTVVYLQSLEDLAAMIAHYHAGAAEAGRDPAALPVATHYQVYCAEDAAEARRVGQQAIRSYVALNNAARVQGAVRFDMNPEEITIEPLIEAARVCIGTPDECAAILARADAALGLASVDCTFYFGDLSYEQARRSLALFAAEVMPRFRAQPVASGATG
jgi:probable F420-dependent oxidoreductase